MFVSKVGLKTVVVPCPKCGVQSGDVRGSYQTSDPETGHQDGWYYALVECPGCEHPFLTRYGWGWVGGDANFSIDDLRILYPSDGELDESVPAKVAHSFTDTIKTAIGGSATATAMMCRRTLECLCLDLGATKWGLQDKLKELGDAKKLDPRLLEWAGDVVKELGDDAAHVKDDIATEDARDAVEFTRALIHNVYVLQRSLEEFKKRRQAAKARV
jgi:hypothetical protein